MSIYLKLPHKRIDSGEDIGGGHREDDEGGAGNIYDRAEEQAAHAAEQRDGDRKQHHRLETVGKGLGNHLRKRKHRHQEHDTDKTDGKDYTDRNEDGHHRGDESDRQMTHPGEVGVEGTYYYLAEKQGEKRQQHDSEYAE